MNRETAIPESGAYYAWLKKRGVSLFEAGGVHWRNYQGALIPIEIDPCYPDVSPEDCVELLKRSRAWLVRYCSDPREQESAWYVVICDRFQPDIRTGKMRYNVRYANRHCQVRIVEAGWLAEHGYACYAAAHVRYADVEPIPEERFRQNVAADQEGPYDHWGVFVGETLVGYCQCLVDQDRVVMAATKYDPAYFKSRGSTGLIDTLIHHYVVERGMLISNGGRPVSHDTNYQDFLLKMGFRKQYCRLNVRYRTPLNWAVRAAYPLRRVVGRLPSRGPVQKLQSLLFQEEIQRQTRRQVTGNG